MASADGDLQLAAAALLKAQFSAAVQHVTNGLLPAGAGDDNGTKLQFYALFKFANRGKCADQEPSLFDFAAHAKWYDAPM